jgi:hypothetical protein
MTSKCNPIWIPGKRGGCSTIRAISAKLQPKVMEAPVTIAGCEALGGN